MTVQHYFEPFNHWVIDKASSTAVDAYKEIPDKDWCGWVKYDNDCESKKRTSRDVHLFGPATQRLFKNLNTIEKARDWTFVTGIPNLQPDPTLHGAGIHVTDPRGFLQVHLDYSKHPKFDLERRLNMLLFLNPEWKEEWGGAFELCDDMGSVVKKIYPAPGRLLLFETSDIAYHGTEQTSLDAPPRATIALYYLAPPRSGITRKRALYVPKRN